MAIYIKFWALVTISICVFNTVIGENATYESTVAPEKIKKIPECPGAKPMGASGDFGKLNTKITESCFYDLFIPTSSTKKVEKDGYMFIWFKNLTLFDGDTIEIISDGELYFGPYSLDHPPPESLIIGPKAKIQVNVSVKPIAPKSVRVVYGFFTAKEVFVVPIKTNTDSYSIGTPKFKPMKKYFSLQYQFNVKPRNKKIKNFTVWLKSQNVANNELALKQQWLKDVVIDPHGTYIVGPVFAILYDLNASNEKPRNLIINYKPINIECSLEISHLKSSKVFKPTTEVTDLHDPFECLIIIREALSPLIAKISNLILSDKLKVEARDGSNYEARILKPKTSEDIIELKSTHENLLISITGVKPIPKFEIDIDCLKCSRNEDLELKPISEHEPSTNGHSGSPLVWILTSAFGGPTVIFIVFAGYKKYRNRQQMLTESGEDNVLFSRNPSTRNSGSLIKFE